MTKKQALKGILFIALFLVILQMVTYMLRTGGIIKSIFTGFYAEPKNTIDVVMIGSSPVYPVYSAPQMWGEQGFTAYPLASNVQRPRAAGYLVKEALKTQSPKLFVFEVRQYIYDEPSQVENMAYTRGVTDNLKYSWNRIDLINDMVADPMERYTYYFDIFKYHSNWKSIVTKGQLTSIFYQQENPLKGYDLNTNVVYGEGTDYSSVTEAMPIDATQEEILKKLLAFLKEKEQDALFIVSPMSLTKEQQMNFNYVKSIVEEAGYSFINLNDYYKEIGIDFSTDFYDGGSHTNVSGSKKCSAFLGEYITQHYDMEDKRTDEKYASWNKAYSKWLKESEAGIALINEKVLNGNYDELVVE